MKIALAAVDIPKNRPRRDHPGTYIDALAASMASPAGQTDPIRVVNNGNSFILVKGLARVLAARKLGWEDIEAEPAPGFMPEQMAAHYAAATTLRAPLPPLVKWKQIVLLQEAGHDMAAAAAILGLSRIEAARMDRLGRLHPDIISIIEKDGALPPDRYLATIANAPLDVQAKAAKAASKGGRGIWHAAEMCAPKERADRVDAIFDLAKVKLNWIEDVFAEPGQRGHFTTPDLPAFLAAQRAALETEKADRDKRGHTVRIVELPLHDNAHPPRGFNRVYSTPAALDKPGKHQVVFLFLLSNGRVERMLALDTAAERAATKAKDKVDKLKGKSVKGATTTEPDPADDAGDDTPTTPIADINPITKAGRDVIASAKTAALHKALDDLGAEDPAAFDAADFQELAAMLILALHASNVTIAGYAETSYTKSDWRHAGAEIVSQLVSPEGHWTFAPATIWTVGIETLRRTLKFGAVSRPMNNYNSNPDSGHVGEWIGAFLSAGDQLERFDAPEFLAFVNAAELRNAAAQAGIKPAKTAAATRALLANNAPDWRPPGTTFGAPGPKPPTLKPTPQQDHQQDDAA